MKKYTFDDIREKGLLLYEYVRGSHAYGLDLPTSDVDTGGIYMSTARLPAAMNTTIRLQ